MTKAPSSISSTTKITTKKPLEDRNKLIQENSVEAKVGFKSLLLRRVT
jgi:hypothetical protein